MLEARLEIESYTVEDLDVRLFGDTALLMGRTRMRGRYDRASFAAHYRFADVCARRQGEWRTANMQITRLGEASAPAD